MVLGASVASRWFVARRGLVIGMMSASSATGQLLVLPLAAWLAENWGWRLAILPALGACALAGLLALLFGRSDPAELGLSAYGDTAGAAPAGPRRSTRSAPLSARCGSGARSQVFWILFGTFFICGLSTNGLIQTHFIPLCHDFGLGEVQAASVLAMMGLFDLVGTIGSGWLSDRYDNRWLLFWYYGLRGLSLIWLPSSSFSLFGLSIFAVFYGLDWIATVPPTVKLAAKDVRTRAGAADVRLGVHRPPARRGDGRADGGRLARHARELPAGLLHRRLRLPGGGRGDPVRPRGPAAGRRRSPAPI